MRASTLIAGAAAAALALGALARTAGAAEGETWSCSFESICIGLATSPPFCTEKDEPERGTLRMPAARTEIARFSIGAPGKTSAPFEGFAVSHDGRIAMIGFAGEGAQ